MDYVTWFFETLFSIIATILENTIGLYFAVLSKEPIIGIFVLLLTVGVGYYWYKMQLGNRPWRHTAYFAVIVLVVGALVAEAGSYAYAALTSPAHTQQATPAPVHN